MALSKSLKIGDLEHIARGAALLGTGGGGDPYIGALLAEQMVRKYGPVEVISINEVSPSWTVLPIAYIGAPTVAVEKLIDIDALETAFSEMEKQIGARADAVISAEMGGCNSMIPISIAAKRGLPIVDADGMGRAFPELPMGTFNIYGVSCTPLVLANEQGESVTFNSRDVKTAEIFARQLVVQMGGSVAMSCYPMTGVEVKRASVPGSLSCAMQVGQVIAEGRQKGDPFANLLQFFSGNPVYGNSSVLFEGKISEVRRETKGGFASGIIFIISLAEADSTMQIAFQNEFLVAECNDEIKAIVPDLICILDQESAEPITTEALRYGQRVKVLGIGAPEILLSDAAMQIVGPQNFGLPHQYKVIQH